MPRDPGDERDQRRLVDVTGVEMLGTGEVIKFVAKNSVPIRDQKMEDELRGGQGKDDFRAVRLTINVCSLSVAHVWASRSGDFQSPTKKNRRFQIAAP